MLQAESIATPPFYLHETIFLNISIPCIYKRIDIKNKVYYFPFSSIVFKLAKIVRSVPKPAIAKIKSTGQASGVRKYKNPTASATQAPVHQGHPNNCFIDRLIPYVASSK